MKRLHVHVSVSDIRASRAFYSTIFGAEPTVIRSDYVKWMLDDPRMNFAISARGRPLGVDHLGIQVETSDELAEMAGQMARASTLSVSLGEITCCYAKTEKSWTVDPQGVTWETFLTLGEETIYGQDPALYERLQALAARRRQVSPNRGSV